MTEFPHTHPISRRASALLNRGDALLVESTGADVPSDRFHYAYLAALRGAGAVLAAVEGVGGSSVRAGRSRSAWVLMSRAAPEFGGWAEYFAGWSSMRIAIEAGASESPTAEEANELRVNVGEFLYAVEDFVGLAGRLDLRAS